MPGLALLAFAVWGLAAPYVWIGRRIVPAHRDVFGVRVPLEVVDHVVPAAIVIAVALVALARAAIPLAAALATVLAGVWMTGTHAPLVLQTARGGADLAASLWHSLPGFLVLLLGAAAAYAAWGEQPEQARQRRS